MIHFTRTLFALFISGLLCAMPAHAEQGNVERWVEQWDEASQQWVRVDQGVERFVAQGAREAQAAIATYGPFRVLDDKRAALFGSTDIRSPEDFAAMLRDFPAIKQLELIECPGTNDDRGNLEVGRMIRAANITTHVPEGGSVRSGAVEIFLAGASRTIEDGASFAVHSWIDNHGREADDYNNDAMINRIYLSYYQEMGMSAEQARAFYSMTNSVPNAQALWLSADDMRAWIDSPASETLAQTENSDTPKISYMSAGYIDSAAVLP